MFQGDARNIRDDEIRISCISLPHLHISHRQRRA